MSTKGRYYKLQVFFQKKEGVSDADFHERWEQHGRVAATQVPELQQYVKRYNQFHCPPELRQAAATSLDMEVLQWDACAEFWMESLEDWNKFSASPGATKLLAPDFDVFIALPLKCMFGYESLHFGSEITFESSSAPG